MAVKQQMVALELSNVEAMELAEFIEVNVFSNIRADTKIDNIYWLHRIVNIHERLMDGCVSARKGDGDD